MRTSYGRRRCGIQRHGALNFLASAPGPAVPASSCHCGREEDPAHQLLGDAEDALEPYKWFECMMVRSGRVTKLLAWIHQGIISRDSNVAVCYMALEVVLYFFYNYRNEQEAEICGLPRCACRLLLSFAGYRRGCYVF